MLKDGGPECVKGLNQLYMLRDAVGRIRMTVAKVTDDFICGAAVTVAIDFIKKMKEKFEFGNVVIVGTFLFNGCEVAQSAADSIKTWMHGYMEALSDIHKEKTHRRLDGTF